MLKIMKSFLVNAFKSFEGISTETVLLRNRYKKCITSGSNCCIHTYINPCYTIYSYTENVDDVTLKKGWEPSISNRYSYRSHTCGELTQNNINQEVKLYGWVHYKRMNQFMTLRDRYGTIQLVIPQSRDDLKTLLKSVPLESIVAAKGIVCQRPVGQENPDMSTGDIEVVVTELSLINVSRKQLPFNIREYKKAKEALQMKYRYLALRFSQLQQNLELRSKLLMRMREYLCYHCNFVDVETPTLFRRTPGGAQEFVVPTREPGLFYSLVQSPQQLKQLLMVGGLDRYFQVARCYRDEGARPDRQPEFTQMDIEMSFVDVNGIMSVVENLMKFSWPENLKNLSIPFPRMTYQEALERYGTDKPDTRFAIEIQDVSNIIPKKSAMFPDLQQGNSSAKCLVFPKEMYISKSALRKYEEEGRKQYPSVKLYVLSLFNNSSVFMENLFSSEESKPLLTELKLYENLVFLAMGPTSDVLALLGHIRLDYCKQLGAHGLLQLESDAFNFLWVYDFPLFTKGKQTGMLESLHHPFTQPHPEDMELLFIDSSKVRGLHYDLVLNGCEIAGGSIRIHDPHCQVAVMEMLGIDQRHLQHIIDALHSGCPPHGGIALGIDRLISLLCGASSLREVIAFPKGFDGKDPMSGSPSPVSEEEMQHFHIKTVA